MPKIIFFFKLSEGGLGVFIGPKWPFGFWSRGPLVAVGSNANINNLGFFPSLTSDAYLKVFSDLDWAYFSAPGKIWMSSFQKTKVIEIPMVGSKVMALGSELTHFAQYSRYLNCFNFDFETHE